MAIIESSYKLDIVEKLSELGYEVNEDTGLTNEKLIIIYDLCIERALQKDGNMKVENGRIVYIPEDELMMVPHRTLSCFLKDLYTAEIYKALDTANFIYGSKAVVKI